MTGYQEFRRLLELKGLTYFFNDNTEMYDIYQRNWSGCRGQDFIVSVPAQTARRDIETTRDIIETAMDLCRCFG